MANQQDNSYQATDIKVLVTDIRIENFKQIKPILEQMIKQQAQNLVIITPDMVEEALASVVLNKVKGAFNCVAIKAPGFGLLRKALLEDISIVTGATYITDEIGMKLEDTKLTDLGSIAKVHSTDKNTIITIGEGREEQIADRVSKLKAEMDNLSGYERMKCQERISKLSGGVAVIHVGAPSEMEMKNKKFKIEDALNATRSAIEEGIVDG
jgi:chaperonin GroEL